MESTRKIVRLDAHVEAPGFSSPLVRAFMLGSAFVGIYNENDFLRYASESFLRMFALEVGQVATFANIVLDAARNGKIVRIEAKDPITFIADAQTRRRSCLGESRQRSFPVDFVDDRWFWCTETVLPDGWIVLTGAEITSLKQTERTLSAQRDEAVFLSGIDELTGVPNRRLTLARLDALLHTPVEGHSPVTVALLDLDHFKSIKDTFVHETGDDALRHFSQHCAGLDVGQSVPGRLGGDKLLASFHA
jgi:predicted signal transduction protein with EAL and GGDEF domain